MTVLMIPSLAVSRAFDCVHRCRLGRLRWRTSRGNLADRLVEHDEIHDLPCAVDDHVPVVADAAGPGHGSVMPDPGGCDGEFRGQVPDAGEAKPLRQDVVLVEQYRDDEDDR